MQYKMFRSVGVSHYREYSVNKDCPVQNLQVVRNCRTKYSVSEDLPVLGDVSADNIIIAFDCTLYVSFAWLFLKHHLFMPFLSARSGGGWWCQDVGRSRGVATVQHLRLPRDRHLQKPPPRNGPLGIVPPHPGGVSRT